MFITTKRRLWMIMPLLLVSLIFVGCSDDDDDMDEGFVASSSDFQNYQNWDMIDYTIYPAAEASLGMAHAGNDPSVARMIYKNGNANMSGSEYNQGAVFVKETFKWDNGAKSPVASGAFFGMAKRGGDYNPDFGGWEYFDLGADGMTVADGMRGSDLMGGDCQGCHDVADNYGGMDYVFPHKTEYEVPVGGEWDVFKDALTWELLDSRTGPDDFLGAAHGITDTMVYRDTYKYQPAAQYANGEFPVGTIIVKDVYKMENNQKTYQLVGGDGGWTAMVKRGGDFNPDNGNWEWFMINPETQSVMGRGGDLMNNMCNGCHASVGSYDPPGGDFVFHHPEMGF